MQFEWDRRGKPHVPTSSWYVSLLFIQTSIDLTCLNSVELQLCPESAPFKLPAFANGDVQTWMKTTFRTELVALRAAAGSPVDLARLQSEVLQRAPGENWSVPSAGSGEGGEAHATDAATHGPTLARSRIFYADPFLARPSNF